MYRHFHRFVSFVAGPLTVKNNFLLVAVMLLCTLAAQAQTIFPVQSTTRILPPYSVYLADYAVNGNDKLQCILVNRDATQTTYQVRLRLTVKLNGRMIMQTSPSFNPTAITLSPNVAQVFAGATLEPYLKSENLDFVGYSRDLYEQNRALPEGFYEIGFAAFDYYRQDVQVSNDGYGFYFLAKNEPPLLNLPACGSKIQPQYSSLIRFSWMPRNTASINSGNSTYYRYFLYEINPRGTNPNDIANSLPPIYVDSTPLNQTFFDLLPTPVLFRDTFEYVWRVQAVDINGADLFRNNGFSEVCTFTWGGPGANPYGSLDSVLSLNAIGETERKGKMWWTKDPVKFDGYKVYYKKSGSGYNWFTSETEADTLRVFDLQPDTEYECRIQGRKNGSYGMYSDVRYFRTKKIIPVECNNVTDVPVSNNNRPMISLQPGAVITYRDFEIRATDSIVSTQAGWFSGKGEISLPFLGGLVFAVKFNNIYIDDAGMVSQGEVHFVSRDLQEWWKEQRDAQSGGNDVGDVITGDGETDHITNYEIASATSIQPVLPIVNGVTSIVILRPDGGRDTLANVTLPYTIKDVNGNIYNVDKNGNVTKVGKSGGLPGMDPARLNKIDLSKAKVAFKPHPSQVYGFDGWQQRFANNLIIAREYEKLTDSVSNTPYYVSSKALAPGKPDKVIAKIDITDQNYKADSVKFVTGKGIVFTPAKTSVAGEYEVTIVGGPAGDAQELFAVYPQAGGYITLGKLKLPSYENIMKEVVLIPVQDSITDIAGIQQYLNEVYGKVNVSYKVSIQPKLTSTAWDTHPDGVLDVSGSNLLTKYSSEMKSLIRTFKSERDFIKDKLYLFILNQAKDEATVAGDMPRGNQFGYIFTGAIGNDQQKLRRTIAHEIGHGTFNLVHLFDETIDVPRGSTSNLMDYSDSPTVSLYKFQWDQIHDPGLVTGILEDNDEAKDVVAVLPLDSSLLNNDKKYFTFITPGGQRIYLEKSKLSYPYFYYGLCDWDNNKRLFGTLNGFTYEEEGKKTEYAAQFDGANNFTGYISGSTPFNYIKPTDNTREGFLFYLLKSKNDDQVPQLGAHVVKFELKNGLQLADYEKGSSVKAITVFDFAPRLFDNNSASAVARQERPFKPSVFMTGKCNDLPVDILESIIHNSEKPEIVYLLSIAYARKHYPEHFNAFSHPCWYRRWKQGINYPVSNFCISKMLGGYKSLFEHELIATPSLEELGDNNPYEFYKYFYTKLLAHLETRVAQTRNFPNTYQYATVTTSQIFDYLYFASEQDIQGLPMNTRMDFIKVLSQYTLYGLYGSMSGAIGLKTEQEELAFKLLKNTPSQELGTLIDRMAKEFARNTNETVLKRLCADFSGFDNPHPVDAGFAGWTNFITWLFEAIKANKPCPDCLVAEKFGLRITNKEVFKFYPGFLKGLVGGGNSYFKSFNGDGTKVNLQHKKISFSANPTGTLRVNVTEQAESFKAVDPYEWVLVEFRDYFRLNSNLAFQKGQKIRLPAIMVYALVNEENNRRIARGVELTFDVIQIAVGAYEIKLAIQGASALGKIGGIAKGIMDMGIGVADIVINDVLYTKLVQTKQGQRILEAWTYIQLGYGLASMSVELNAQALRLRNEVNTARAQGYLENEGGTQQTLTAQEQTALDDVARSSENAARTAYSPSAVQTAVNNLKTGKLANAARTVAFLEAAPDDAVRMAIATELNSFDPATIINLERSLANNTALGNSTRAAALRAAFYTDPAWLQIYRMSQQEATFGMKYWLINETTKPDGKIKLPLALESEIEEISITFRDDRGNLSTTTIKDKGKGPSPLGKLFEADYISRAEDAFRTGNFAIVPELQAFYNQNYRLTVRQVQVNIPDAKPIMDVVLFRRNALTGAADITQPAIYVETKIDLSTNYTPPQNTFINSSYWGANAPAIPVLPYGQPSASLQGLSIRIGDIYKVTMMDGHIELLKVPR
ncbi:hypothetical protein HB364_26335 [Pseudoflavitalea sp. X16]|uniref:fibronectin type III domain-containing protein n=1 Tax=Paraflavitalea devenefica TaxID=2716334 RepID=UPI001423343E|nr:fibronectin type III domain-containing protein [Paraflavitalea devenefica]NII28630.1 hypothetical protein [Paraflavitalea devenefica]